MATVAAWTRTESEALREAMRATFEEFGAELGVAERTVKRWKSGQSRISMHNAGKLDDLLNRAGPAVQARFVELCGGDDMNRRTLFKAAPVVAAGLLNVGLDADHAQWLTSGAGRADAAAVAAIRHTLYAAMQLDDTLGSPAAQGMVIAQEQVTEAMLRDCGPDVQAALLSLHAEWIGFAGALAWDAGEYPTAQRLYNLARDKAHEAEDDDLAAYMLAGLSQLAIWQRKPRVAMDHAAAATSWIRGTEDRQLSIYVHLRMAEASAIAGKARACRDALDAAQGAMDGVQPGHPSSSRAYYVGPAFVDSYVGGCLTLIGEADEAVAASRRAVAALPDSYTRDRAVTLLELEAGLIQLGEIEEAAAAVTEAVRLTEVSRSPRLSTAIRDARRELAPWAGTGAVRALDAELAARAIVTV
ncbi:helix-turn-helix domain-containing protein [Nocardia asteroides]|uniref:helix-turn-helix domain-containing protein n=1 Tax=Nocardia asteroides TaxID=1824 RepID=UPI0033CD4543